MFTERYQKDGSVQDLKTLLEFMVEFYKQKEIFEVPNFLENFMIDKNRPDYLNLLMRFNNNWSELIELCGFSILHYAVEQNKIELVKLLLKYSEEQELDIYQEMPNYRIIEFHEHENILELAKRLQHSELTELIQNVYDGKIKVKDLKPNITKPRKVFE